MADQEPRRQQRNLVGEVAEQLRERILAAEPGTLIGSLQELSGTLGVGIVTIQQAARVLEHEGLLEARRGPGGGYYGVRPDDAALERALATYLRVHPASFEEALDMTSLLFTELAAAAAANCDDEARASLQAFDERLRACTDLTQSGEMEPEFQELLFRIVRWPLFEMITRVVLRYAVALGGSRVHPLEQDVEKWKEGRHRIIAAIAGNDRDLARFEANRSNRLMILERLREMRG